MTIEQADEPLMLQPVLRALEVEAIRLYRDKHPDSPLWQELDPHTRSMWVKYAEKENKNDH